MEHDGKSLFTCVCCLVCTCYQLPPSGNFTVGEDYTFEYINDEMEMADDSGNIISFPEHIFPAYFDNQGEAITSFGPLLQDNTKYHVYLVLDGINCSLEEIKVCAKIMNVNYLQARRMLTQKRNLLATGSACDIHEILETLAAFHVQYEIEPILL